MFYMCASKVESTSPDFSPLLGMRETLNKAQGMLNTGNRLLEIAKKNIEMFPQGVQFNLDQLVIHKLDLENEMRGELQSSLKILQNTAGLNQDQLGFDINEQITALQTQIQDIEHAIEIVSFCEVVQAMQSCADDWSDAEIEDFKQIAKKQLKPATTLDRITKQIEIIRPPKFEAQAAPQPLVGAIVFAEDGDLSLNTALELTKNARDLMQKVRTTKAATIDDFLHQIHALDEAKGELIPYASRFEGQSARAHLHIQNTMSDLSALNDYIQRLMGSFVQANYYPDAGVPVDGNCLFWSISRQLNNGKSQAEMRKAAVESMKQHRPVLEEDIQFTLSDKVEGLFSRLFKRSMSFEGYCDLIEKTKKWGGQLELKALSLAEKRPVIVMGKHRQNEWKVDLLYGFDQFPGVEPLLLYYSGESHYQNLVRK